MYMCIIIQAYSQEVGMLSFEEQLSIQTKGISMDFVRQWAKILHRLEVILIHSKHVKTKR